VTVTVNTYMQGTWFQNMKNPFSKSPFKSLCHTYTRVCTRMHAYMHACVSMDCCMYALYMYVHTYSCGKHAYRYFHKIISRMCGRAPSFLACFWRSFFGALRRFWRGLNLAAKSAVEFFGKNIPCFHAYNKACVCMYLRMYACISCMQQKHLYVCISCVYMYACCGFL
jgi:hypothetical protein